MNTPHIYDKAKYHSESVQIEGLSEDQDLVHTGLYFGWLIERNLLDVEFIDEFELGKSVAAFRERSMTGPQIYGDCDGVLTDDMISEEGNAFSMEYFDFERGVFVQDYMDVFNVSGGNDFFGVADTWDNYNKIKEVFDLRYKRWKRSKEKKSWEFWK